MGETVRLTPSSLRSDADSILSIRTTIEQAGRNLESGLSGTAGMLGSDPTAEDAGPALQEAIDNALTSLRSTVTVVGSFAVLTQATARAYRQSELAGAYLPLGNCEIPEPAILESPPFSVPNVEGADSPPFVEGIEDALQWLGIVVPNGDPDKLKAAAEVWRALSTDMSAAATALGVAGTSLTSAEFPSSSDTIAVRSSSVAFVTAISDGAIEIANNLVTYADNINNTREELLWMVGEFAIEIAIDIGLTIALSFIPGGTILGSAKAAVTIAKWARKINELIDRLRGLQKLALRAIRAAGRGMGEAVKEAVVTGVTTVVINTARANDPNYQQRNPFVAAAAAGISGGVTSPIGNRYRPGGGGNSTWIKRAGAEGAEGAAGGVVEAAVTSAATGEAFNPLQAATLGALLAGPMNLATKAGTNVANKGMDQIAPHRGRPRDTASGADDGPQDGPAGRNENITTPEPIEVNAPDAPASSTPASTGGQGGAPATTNASGSGQGDATPAGTAATPAAPTGNQVNTEHQGPDVDGSQSAGPAADPSASAPTTESNAPEPGAADGSVSAPDATPVDVPTGDAPSADTLPEAGTPDSSVEPPVSDAAADDATPAESAPAPESAAPESPALEPSPEATDSEATAPEASGPEATPEASSPEANDAAADPAAPPAEANAPASDPSQPGESNSSASETSASAQDTPAVDLPDAQSIPDTTATPAEAASGTPAAPVNGPGDAPQINIPSGEIHVPTALADGGPAEATPDVQSGDAQGAQPDGRQPDADTDAETAVAASDDDPAIPVNDVDSAQQPAAADNHVTQPASDAPTAGPDAPGNDAPEQDVPGQDGQDPAPETAQDPASSDADGVVPVDGPAAHPDTTPAVDVTADSDAEATPAPEGPTVAETGRGDGLPPDYGRRPDVLHTVTVAAGDPLAPKSDKPFGPSVTLAPNTEYHVEGREGTVFYTGPDGRIEWVTSKWSDSVANRNPDLNNPLPNVTYVIKPLGLENTATHNYDQVFQTDNEGRTVAAFTQDLGIADRDSTFRDRELQSGVGVASTIEMNAPAGSYHGGHIFGAQNGGGTDALNMIGMRSDINSVPKGGHATGPNYGDTYYGMERDNTGLLTGGSYHVIDPESGVISYLKGHQGPGASVGMEAHFTRNGDVGTPEFIHVFRDINRGEILDEFRFDNYLGTPKGQ